MTERSTRRLAWGLFATGLVGLVASFLIDLRDGRPGQWAEITQVTAFAAIGVAGLAIARRHSSNAVGWIYLGVWAGVGIVFALVGSYAYWATVHHAPGGTQAVWFGNWLWVPIFGVLLTFPFLLFPDGHLPSRRWRPVAWAAGIALVLWSIAFALETHDYTDAFNRSAPNPYTIPSLVPIFNVGREVLAIATLTIMGLCIASLIVRFRSRRGDEREQIKWVAFAAAVLLVWLAIPLDHGTGGPADAVQGLVLALVPSSVGIAIVKYRLYDIDLVIKKALIALVLALLLATVGLFVVATAGQVALWRGTPKAISVLVGIVIGALFVPLLQLARRIANRLVYGRRATPYEVLSTFSTRVADTYSIDDVLPRMAQVLTAGTGASSARVLLRVGSDLREVAAHGEPEGQEHRTLVTHQGEALGALVMTFPANDPIDPLKERLVNDMAMQAGLVLRNVRLIEELKASRQRLVAAQDEERRKLERNIHDGAQQQLVALSVKQRLAASLIGKDDDRARSMLEDMQAQTDEALEDLRDLARGIYPPLLADKGLSAALEAQARKAAVPTTVEADGTDRYEQDTEATVYFCALEALQNVAKYANATHARIHLAWSNGMLTFAVQDDGDGFDPGSTPYGTGLQGMADRLDAVGGSLVVTSEPGRGTTVSGTVPAEELPS